MDTLAVIPARGGSKAIPRKNLALVAGKPLLAWTAETALACPGLGRVVLSTDDHAIAEAGRAMGLEVPFLRPPRLAADDTPMLPVLRHALDEHVRARGREPEAVVLLQPTSPMRRREHVEGALRLFEETGADTVVSVVEVPHRFTPSSLMREAHGFLEPYDASWGPLRRQEKTRLWARNGPVVLVTRPVSLRQGTLYGKATRAYPMNSTDSLDVDGPEDLALADLLLRPRAMQVGP